MKVWKSISYTVNTRQYESIKVELGAEATHGDLGITDDNLPYAPAEQKEIWDRLWAKVSYELHGQTDEALGEIATLYPHVNLATDVVGSTKYRRENDANRTTKVEPRRAVRGRVIHRS